MWTDEHGKTLADYWRPSVAVDVALVTVAWTGRAGQLSVLLHQPQTGFAAGKWALPGTFLRDGERLDAAVLRALRDKVGVQGQTPCQLGVFDAPDRDDRGRVLSVAHVDIVPGHRLELPEDAVALAPVHGQRATPPGGQKKLPYDHDQIVADAVRWARAQYQRTADPFALAGDQFTLSDLQRVHEAVAGKKLVKDTFRRAVSEYIAPTGTERTGTVGRPAALYRHLTGAERGAGRST